VRQLIHVLLEAHLFQAHAASHPAAPNAIHLTHVQPLIAITRMVVWDLIIMIMMMWLTVAAQDAHARTSPAAALLLIFIIMMPDAFSRPPAATA